MVSPHHVSLLARHAQSDNPGGTYWPASWIARQTRIGVTGMSTWRTPRRFRASTTAFCTAGVEPIVPASPMPFTPRVSIRGRLHGDAVEAREFGCRRDGVVHEVAGLRVAPFVVDEFLHQGLADAAGHAAVDLTVDDGGVDDDAGVVARRGPLSGPRRCRGRRRQRRDARRTGTLPPAVAGRSLRRVVGCVSGLRCDLCPADSHTRRTRDGKRACAGIEDNVRGIGLEDIGGTAFACSTTVLVAFQIAVPPSSERGPPVPPPRLTSSVSPWQPRPCRRECP